MAYFITRPCGEMNISFFIWNKWTVNKKRKTGMFVECCCKTSCDDQKSLMAISKVLFLFWSVIQDQPSHQQHSWKEHLGKCWNIFSETNHKTDYNIRKNRRDNPELQATLGTRHRTKMNNVEITTQKTKKMSITDPTTTRGVCTGLVLM